MAKKKTTTKKKVKKNPPRRRRNRSNAAEKDNSWMIWLGVIGASGLALWLLNRKKPQQQLPPVPTPGPGIPNQPNVPGQVPGSGVIPGL